MINRKIYYYHRILWIFLKGEITEGLELDHIDHNKLNNSIENLRLVLHKENSKNKSFHIDNTCGITGVNKHQNKWQARICVNGEEIYLGIFDNKADAYVRYKSACKKYGFHKNHGKIITLNEKVSV